MTASEHKMLTWSSARTAYTIVLVGAVALMELGARLYRPWVLERAIDDRGVAATLGAHLGTVAQIFAVLALVHATKLEARLIVVLVTAGYCIYDLARIWLPGSAVGARDIVATLAGGLIAYLVLLVVERWSEAPG